MKGLVELLKGKIWLESKPGEGSRFIFTFPYKSVVATNTPNESQFLQEEEILSGKILIVEDDYYNAEYIKELLYEHNVSFLYAETGKEAIKIAAGGQIDVVLLDIRLPDMEGYEVAGVIKRQNPEIRIIAQTAYASSADKQKALDSGCDDYISKPLNRELLLLKLSKLIKI
ncbi:MAG: response regulator [Bacteroidetes bacterium]|nr:response regulator [Bacteroidota bacterium]